MLKKPCFNCPISAIKKFWIENFGTFSNIRPFCYRHPFLIESFKPLKPSVPIEQYSQYVMHCNHSLQPNLKQSSKILYQGVVKEIVAKNQDAGVAIIAFAKPAVSCILPV